MYQAKHPISIVTRIWNQKFLHRKSTVKYHKQQLHQTNIFIILGIVQQHTCRKRGQNDIYNEDRREEPSLLLGKCSRQTKRERVKTEKRIEKLHYF